MFNINTNGITRFKTKNKVCTDNIDVNVNVPQPTGSVTITQNGTTDVTNYASAVVNVPTMEASVSNETLVFTSGASVQGGTLQL